MTHRSRLEREVYRIAELVAEYRGASTSYPNRRGRAFHSRAPRAGQYV
jgi:hypothetical protein